MVVMEWVKRFAGQDNRPPLYFYRTQGGTEVDLIVDQGDHLELYEIKYTASPSIEMTRGMAQFAAEHKRAKASLLTLRKEPLSFSNGVTSRYFLV